MEDMNLIYSYSRKEALEDGVLIDVSEIAKEAGFIIPTAVTSNLYETYVKPSDAVNQCGQSIEGRLWDILHLLRLSIKDIEPDTSILFFHVNFLMQNGIKRVQLKSVIAGGDNGEPVLTIMNENED